LQVKAENREAKPAEKRRALKLRRSYLLAGAAILATSMVFALQALYSSQIGTISDLLAPIYSGVATISSFLAFRKYGLKLERTFNKAWLFFTVGLTFWFLGEFTWGVYVFLLRVSIPYPSVADVFYLGGYAPLFLGTFLYVKMFSSALSGRRLYASLGAIAASVGTILAFIIMPKILENENTLAKAFDIGYPVLDSVLLAGAILGFAIFYGGSIGKSWVLLVTALVLQAIADIMFSYATVAGT
jgi:hypothetical protein